LGEKEHFDDWNFDCHGRRCRLGANADRSCKLCTGQSLLRAQLAAVSGAALRQDQGQRLPAGHRRGHGAADPRSQAIADSSAPPTFENTIVAMERTGQLLTRAWSAFNCVTGANTNDDLQKVQDYEAPRLAAHQDAIYLNSKLFARVKAIYDQRASLHLDPNRCASSSTTISSL
jgi:hypothetical protein